MIGFALFRSRNSRTQHQKLLGRDFKEYMLFLKMWPPQEELTGNNSEKGKTFQGDKTFYSALIM